MVVLKVDDAGNEKTETIMLSDGSVQDERIEKIEILPKVDELLASDTSYEPASYLAHRHLSPNKWVEIMFVGLDEHIIGKIINVVGDSAEIVIFEDGVLLTDSPLVLDFNYTGLPDGVISIELIEDVEENEKGEDKEEEKEEEYVVEDLNIQIAEERDFSKLRYGLEEQTNDILESMLSKLQTDKKIEKRTLASINQTIIRYTQLRELFSKFDGDHNMMHYHDKTEAVNKHGNNWKPLCNSLSLQNKQLGWVFPIAQHIKKIYVEMDGGDADDLASADVYSETFKINDDYSLYSNGKLAYSSFFNNISPYLTPFEKSESNFLVSPEVDVDVFIGNFNNKFSNSFKHTQVPFQSSRYVSDINYIMQTNLTKSSYKTTFHPLIPAEEMHVNALMTFPDTFMKHSRLRLPGTDTIGRSNMALMFPSYSRILTSKTPITSLISDNINVPIVGNTFMGDHFKQYSYSGDEVLNYSQFLDYFIPSTQDIIAKHKLSQEHLSIVSIVSELEPYLIYMDDLTATHYNVIANYLQQNSKHFFSDLTVVSRAFAELKKSSVFIQQFNGPTLVIDNDLSSDVRINVPYYFSSGKLLAFVNNTEEMSRVLALDCGRIFSAICAYNAIALIADVSNIQNDIVDAPIEASPDVCITKIIAKKYKNVEKMQADNGVDIYFDKEYDTTSYSILNEPHISKKKFSLSGDEFAVFLTKELEKLKTADIPIVIQSLMTGHRIVVDGQLAILVDEYGEKVLYKRENNVWEIDPTAPKNIVDVEMLCNAQPNCLIRKNKCETIEKTRTGIEDSVLSERETFGAKINETIRAYQFKIENDYAKTIGHVNNTRLPIEAQSNFLKIMLGVELKNYDIVVSPYAKYVNLILSHPDFEKRQDLIVRFCDSRICRAGQYENEDMHWFYCSETDTKLIPTFFVQLARAHFQGRYNLVMDVVLRERKATDDNGTIWIDKYSGYAIKHIDFDSDEGYNEEGYRVVSREVLSADETEKEMEMMMSIDEPVKSRMEYDRTGQSVYGIIDTLSRHMLIDISSTYSFIIKTAIKIYKGASMSEVEYKKTKSETPYAVYLTQYLNYITLAVYLIVCQTMTPNLTPKGTFPGCIKSFEGYPVGPIEDKRGIIYLLCILTKTKFIKVSSKPAFFEQYIDIALQDASIRTLISKKKTSGKVEEKEVEHSITKWTSFQPPLVPFKLPTILNVHENFEELLIGDINSGSRSQHDKMSVLQSKIILFSYSIQAEIQKIIDSEPLILKSYDSKLLNENACCNGSIQMTTLDYFKIKNASGDIEMCNNAILAHRNILNGMHLITTPVMWLSDEKTKILPIQIEPAFSEKTIYAGFVKHCNFRNNAINPDNITAICGEKPVLNIKLTDTIEEIIAPLKNSGILYSSEQLYQLLHAVSKQIVYAENTQVVKTTVDGILAFLSELDNTNDSSIIQKPFQDKIQDCFTADESRITSAIKELKHYTFNGNAYIYQKIRGFSVSVKNRLFKPEHIDLLFLERERTQMYFQFLKNSIVNVGQIFPSMCITQTKHFSEKLPTYWGITQLHNNMLISGYTKLFERVTSYYGEHATFFKYIVESSSKIIEMISDIPFTGNEIGFLVLEHCLLLVLDIYMTVDENRIEDESLYDAPNANVSISTTQLTIMQDFIITLMTNDKHINVPYQAIVDATFRLKELEKNKLLQELNNTKDLAIDNHFKVLRIGDRWGGGENVREHNKQRSDKEINEFLEDQTMMVQGQNQEDNEVGVDGEVDMDDYVNDFESD